MAQPVNLNRFRKSKARADSKVRADENAVKFGRTKAQKSLDEARREQDAARLSTHKIDPK